MITLASYSVDFILPMISDIPGTKAVLPVGDRKFQAGVSSLRLQCFKRSKACATCGIEGNLFLLQKSHVSDKNPHLNMFHVGDGGSMALMTKDHIVPVSRGGLDIFDNVQTMCASHNGKKGNSYLPIEIAAKIREAIAGLRNHGMNDYEIWNRISNLRFEASTGFRVMPHDLVSIILGFMSEKPGEADICTECAHMYSIIS